MSIVVPTATIDRFLVLAIDSVVKQEGVDLECLIVLGKDAECSDAAFSYDEPRVRIIRSNAESPGEAIQSGLDKATGEFIGILSSDDIYQPGALRAVVEHFDCHLDEKFAFGNVDYIDQSNHRIRRMRIAHPTLERLREKSCLSTSATFYRKSLFESHGQFDPSYRYWMGYEFWIRLAEANVPFGAIDKTLGGKRLHPNNRVSGEADLNHSLAANREALAMLRKRFGIVGNHWPLRDARTRARRLGLYRTSSIKFDIKTVRFAWAHIAGEPSSKRERVIRFGRLLRQHVKTEASEFLRRPKYLVRLFPRLLRSKYQVTLGRRFFQLRFGSPRPCRLPKSQLSTVKLKHAPKISIATPNLNQGQFIERTILSVINQDYPNLEYVIQDGCSKDESLDVIRKYANQLSYWQSIKDRGQAHAINLGLRQTTGDIMAYLNSDDVLLPGSLSHIANYFQKHPEIDIVYGNRLLIDENDLEINRWVLPSHDPETITWADYIPQETLFWRRSAWEAVGGALDESFQFAMDWDLILRFRAAGLRFARLPRFLGAFRITDGQKTSQLIASIGVREMGILRHREHGRIPCDREVTQRTRAYVKRQWYTEKIHAIRDSLVGLVRPPVVWNGPKSIEPLPATDLREAV